MDEFWKTFWPNNLKDILQILQSLFVIIGVGVAVRLYYKRRKPYPRLILTQEVFHYVLSADKVLLRVKLTLENKGEGLLCINKGCIWLQQVFPIIEEANINTASTIAADLDPVKDGALEVEWPIIAERELDVPFVPREIEPGETDEVNVDFIVNNEKSILIAYTLIGNPQRKNIDWQKATVYQVPDSNEAEDTTTKGGTITVPNSNSNNQPAKKVITPDPDDGSKGGSPKPKPPKVKQPAKKKP